MALPPAVAHALLQAGVAAETAARIDDLYHLLGPAAIEAVADEAAERGVAPAALAPQDLDGVRARIGARYLAQHHAAWMQGEPTAAFWRDRRSGGAATGMAVPLGDLGDPDGSIFAARVARATREASGPDQPSPRGLLLVTRNAHVGNQEGSFSFDLVPVALEDALALNAATGRQHTLPGSIGEVSGRARGNVALVWEVQPNVYKPGQDRNREAGRAWRRHRSWPFATAAAALAWLGERGYATWVLAGAGLRAAHEVDPEQPLGEGIARLHDRTFAAAAEALGVALEPAADTDAEVLTALAKVNLGAELASRGAPSLAFRVRR